MGNCAETLAKEHKITREEQDAFAATSYTRAIAAIKNGKFAAEIVPVPIPQRKGDPVPFLVDEEPGRGNVQSCHSPARVREERHRHRRKRVDDQRQPWS